MWNSFRVQPSWWTQWREGHYVNDRDDQLQFEAKHPIRISALSGPCGPSTPRKTFKGSFQVITGGRFDAHNKDNGHFACEKLKYLGVVISEEGIRTDESKVKAITQMKPPKTAQEIATFLGMTGWYQNFIQDCAEKCEPLYALKRKKDKFVRSAEAQLAFEEIKRVVTEATVLKLADFNIPFELFTDASTLGIGVVLTQQQITISFVSRNRNKVERNYSVTERSV
ncbi:retrovirus-related Pol polyprotein from transposon opus [Trichonephila clavipes]|nr:retrovirus-related Pol polyprotein from transposon opus [Trichonephila clavipes]